jgi:hypothetical protein
MIPVCLFIILFVFSTININSTDFEILLLGGSHRMKALAHPLVLEYIKKKGIDVTQWSFKLLRVEIWTDFKECINELFKAIMWFDNNKNNANSIIRTSDAEMAVQIVRHMRLDTSKNLNTNALKEVILSEIVCFFI